ncbi:MAG: hypothetical protein WCC06_12770 [Candidatus Aminicenantales bacterium]
MTERNPDDLEIARDTTIRLLAYCSENQWAGYDPYDALNSRVFRALPFLDFKLARLMLTQGVKRCPINLRPLLLVAKTPNPKGIALFLSSLIKLSKIGLVEGTEIIGAMADKLLALRSPDKQHACWGYNFDWQTRGELVPKGSPNIICSTFAANALLDAYEQSRESSWLNAAISAAEFNLESLFWRDSGSKACFSYTPLGRSEIHNANLLGAALLCRVSQVSGQGEFLEPALDAARYSVSKQHEDGSWDYGESPFQRWIDNFHTGYNLVALRRISEYGRTKEFDTAIRHGFKFYKAHFFREDGVPRYFHNAAFPIDIHSVAQSIITLIEFGDIVDGNINLAHSVLHWAMANMWDARGFFYFQKLPYYTVRIPFMRWSQAWMLLALATLLDERPSAHGQLSP